MGWIYHRKGDFQKAVDLLQRVQAKAPDSPIANYHLGMALAGAGKREQAREMLRKSLAAKVDFPGREDARKALEKL
jgi:Flp pilus assembly protein TadD